MSHISGAFTISVSAMLRNGRVFMLQVIEKVLFEVLPQALDRFDTDAWTSCISPVMKAIARGLF